MPQKYESQTAPTALIPIGFHQNLAPLIRSRCMEETAISPWWKKSTIFWGINESYYSCAYLESTVNTEARGWEADDEFAFPPELSASSKAWVFANGNRIFYCAIWQSFDSMYRFLPKKSAAKFASSDTYDKSAGCGNRGSCSRPMKDR